MQRVTGLRKPSERFKVMLQEELQALSLVLDFDEQEEALLEWEALKSNFFDLESEEAALWQRRSRSKMLGEGNEPSPFFFGLLKVNQNHKWILSITDLEGLTFVDERDILAAIRKFYENIFAKDVALDGNVEARRLLLEHTIDKLIDLDRSFLGAPPDLDELWETLRRMPSDRARGSGWDYGGGYSCLLALFRTGCSCYD